MLKRTIRKEISRTGIGLHSGEFSKITFKPNNNGIIFYNTFRDKERKHPIKASPFEVVNTSYATVIGSHFPIQTVEHILSALHALYITDITIEIEADEPPVFDGSSYTFIELLREAGIKELDEEVDVININYPIWYKKDDLYIIGLPSDKFEVTYSIDFAKRSKAVGRQSYHLEFTSENYITEISRARTFGFYEDITWLKNNNLALGGSLENSLVYSGDELLNDELRYEDEAVRHKMLDLIGDIYLLGNPIKGHIIAHKAGHAADVEFAKKLLNAYRTDISIKKLNEIEQRFESIINELKITI